MITHYDLFAGIGGFSLALEEVFTDATIRHIFCEWESFPTAVLKRHWPDGEFHGDIAELVTHTRSAGLEEARTSQPTKGSGRGGDGHASAADTASKRLEGGARQELQGRDARSTRYGNDFTIVTGGFPCQPFSAAGRRKGTEDDRYQWPNMFEVIRNTKPRWVIAENVRGLVTWNDGLVLETVCADLESEGYEVQPFIIPAVAVGAPHRRDRVWIIGHRLDTNSQRISTGLGEVQSPNGEIPQRHTHAEPGDTGRQLITDSNDSGSRTQGNSDDSNGQTSDQGRHEQPQYRANGQSGTTPDTESLRNGGSAGQERRAKEQLMESNQRQGSSVWSEGEGRSRDLEYPDWSRNWQEVAFATCDDSMDDGLSRIVDGVPYSRAKWRKDSLKAYGNGIVMQVAVQIMKGIKEATV